MDLNILKTLCKALHKVFRVLKSKGLAIEESQLETGGGLKKLAVIALQVALTTMTLKLSLSNTHKVNANIIFSKEQLHFLSIYMEKLEGKIEKLKNPYDKGSLQWATWAMGRLGGWRVINLRDLQDIYQLRMELTGSMIRQTGSKWL